jgi:transposase
MANTRLPIDSHLPPEEIARRYRACRTGVEKTHWRVIGLMTRPEQPLTPAQAAAQVGLSAVWVRALLRRWNAEGPGGLAGRREGTDGGRSELTTDRQIDLWDVLQRTPPDGGLWTGPRVAAYVRDRWGVGARPQTGWDRLRGPGSSLQVPRPSHPEAATPAGRRAWKRRPGCPPRRDPPAASREARRVVGRG